MNTTKLCRGCEVPVEEDICDACRQLGNSFNRCIRTYKCMTHDSNCVCELANVIYVNGVALCFCSSCEGS